MFEQDRVIMRLQQRLLGENDIATCFLAGAHGRRLDDAYSDLDVALVFATEEKRQVAWEQRDRFAQSVLPYISCKSFDASHIRPLMHIALYSNGTKVDYRYETKDSLQPNPWDRDIRLLKDTDDWGKRFQTESSQTSMRMPELSLDELQLLDRRFWVMFMDVFRLVLRGDYDKPFTVYLELLHFSIPPLLAVLPKAEPARQGLLRASFSHDTQKTAAHMAALLDAYVAAREAVIKRFHLPFAADSRFEKSIVDLVKRNA